MRVLFLSVSLPPFPESHTIRSLYLIRRLVELGFNATLVSPEVISGGDMSLFNLLPAECVIIRTPPTPYDQNLAHLSNLPAGKWLVWLYMNVFHRIAVPDVRVGWERIAIKTCQSVIADLKPDIIVSASGSCTAHLAAWQLAKQYSLPWVAEFGDPWSLVDLGPSHRWLAGWRNRILERKVIVSANGLVFTTEETLEAYRRWLGSRLPPAIYIPHGYLASDFLKILIQRKEVKHSRLEISHIGVASRDRSLIPLIRALSILERDHDLKHGFHLNVIGPYSPSFEEEARKLSLQATFHGLVSYRESIDWILRSDVLLIVGNKGALQIPGKVYRALASGRPIVYIQQRPSDSDPACRVLSYFPGVLYAQNSVEAITTCLKDLDMKFSQLHSHAIERVNMENLKEYESQVIGDRFAHFLHQVLKEYKRC